MTQQSASATAILREDGELILRRTRHDDHANPVLELATVSGQPAAATLRRLEHEYALAPELHAGWAVPPLALTRRGGRTVLVLEDTGGEPLNRLLGQPLELTRFLPLAIDIAAALAQVHARGLIHKDIKPANILVDSGGKVRLTGFGIASRLPRERLAPEPPEIIAGTLAYMAPEQTGRMNRSIDSRSDLYSLGVTFYEMLTGALPFAAVDPLEWIHCHIARRPIPPGERVLLPAPLSDIVMKLLSKTAESRYQTAAGLASDLRFCRAQWEQYARIDSFAIGASDVSGRLLIPERLYGREPAINTLLAAFDGVVADGIPTLMLVSGYSGIGKSSVVSELHRRLVLPPGLFAAGKFDQYRRDIPYTTLAQAFHSLIQQLLAKSEAQISPWREEILSAVGANGQIMVNLIPELELIIGKQPPVPDVPPQETPDRFRMVFRRFLGVFARAEHPLTLFFDDLQWLDTATLDLLEYLMTEARVGHLLLVGAYRDNEVGPTHPLMRRLDAIRESGSRVNEIKLAPLAVEDIGSLIADALHCETQAGLPLARLVHAKTGGNPFFVIQFITALEEDGLLAFDASAVAWRWDLARIRAKNLTDNVVHLLVAKLNRLRDTTLVALKQLACLGNVAETVTLTMVLGMSEEAAHSDLWEAELAGLIIRLEGAYRFPHDRVQEAAYSLIPEGEREAAHLRIGRLLWSRMTPQEIDTHSFEIVSQLNRGVALITSAEERLRLADLNLIAGRRARQSTAYAAALTYLTAGGKLLTEECWTGRYDLAFALEFHRGECEFLSGALAAAEQRLSLLADRARNLVDAATVACLRLTLYQALDRNDRAVDVCFDYFQSAGIPWPRHPTKDNLRSEYGRLWRLLAGHSIEALVDLPAMRDRNQRAILDVLTSVLAPALLTNTDLFRLTVCRMAILSLEHGNSDGSCLAYLYLNLIFRERGDFQTAFRFAKLGLDLVDRGLDRFKTRIYAGFGSACSPWTEHLRVGLAFLQRSCTAAQETGDLTFALYSYYLVVPHRLALGDSLADVQRDAESALESARKLRFNQVIASVIPHLQLMRALRGLTTHPACFDDDEFDEARFERELEEDSRLGSPACWYWIRKLQAFFLADDHAPAVAAAAKAQMRLWTSLTVFDEAEFHLYAALARAAHCDTVSPDERPRYLAMLAAHSKHLDTLASHNPQSFTDRARLVAAEIARLDGRELEAQRLYEQAICAARDGSFVQNEALACERAARFYAARGLQTIAHALLRNARYCYRQWGALAKLRELDRREPGLRDEPAPLLASETIRTPVAQLDVATLIKAAQAVSSEIVLDRLIETLLGIAMEHAGAERGLLILLRNDKLHVEAEATAERGKIELTVRRSEVTPGELPQTVLHYVLRTRANLILGDAITSDLFSQDEYIRRLRVRSVLCLPLVKQLKLFGLLYLENKLTPHAFTGERLALLDVLAAQAAISLENARLYAELREREGHIRDLVESSIIGIFFWNLSGAISDPNDEFLRTVGYSRADHVLGRLRWNEMTPPEYVAADARAIDAIQAGRFCAPYEKEFYCKDGGRVPVLVGGTLLQGSKENGVAFVLDLTERKQAEREREARRAAEAANRAKSEFLSYISHELRTPLNGILGYAQILQRDPGLSERQLSRLSVIQHSGEHLLALINDLLDLARIEAGKLELAATIVPLLEFLRNVTDVIRIEAKAKGLELICDTTLDLPDAIEADEKRLRQVLLNLLINAVKFTEHGEVRLLVRTRPPNRLCFEVRDTGIGIATDQLESIFERFVQVGEARQRFRGTGLGLAISRQIVRLMGGEIQVTSRVGAGSTFSFELQLPARDAAIEAANLPAARGAIGYGGRRRTVLVIDDALESRAVLLDVLDSFGFETAQAVSGEEGLEKARDLRPDLILTDLVMPEMDGHEVVRRLRQLPGLTEVPVIVLSAQASGGSGRKSLPDGANAFLSKPIDVAELLKQIATLLKLEWAEI
jgi:PAS domain S-box-containing protein